MGKAPIRVGQRAPSFSLPNQDRRKVSLSGQKGHWVVLYFYAKDNTPGCTTEASEFTSSAKRFERMNAKVLGISADPPDSHKKFIQKKGLKVELLSDTGHKVLGKYGAWGTKSMYGKKFQGAIRSTVLIDPKGRVAAHWPKVLPRGHATRVRQKLAEVQAEAGT